MCITCVLLRVRFGHNTVSIPNTKPLFIVSVLDTKTAVFCASFGHKELPYRVFINCIFCIPPLIFPLFLYYIGLPEKVFLPTKQLYYEFLRHAEFYKSAGFPQIAK